MLTDRLGGGSLLHPLRSFGRWLLRRGLFDRASRLGRLMGRLHTPFDAVELASDAVARGNRKVFEEIGLRVRALARRRRPGAFVASLRDGDPPDGQRYLKAAFTRYAAPSPVRSSCCFANLVIGLHEQTRLQPEISEALDAPYVTAEELGRRLCPRPAPAASSRPRRCVAAPGAGQARRALARADHALADGRSSVPGRILLLGANLADPYPRCCGCSSDAELAALVAQFEPAVGPGRLRRRGLVGPATSGCTTSSTCSARSTSSTTSSTRRSRAAQVEQILAGVIPTGILGWILP